MKYNKCNICTLLKLKMTGYDLRLWRKSLGWSRERAAEELGVCLRSYKDYENAEQVKRSIELASITLALNDVLPTLQHRKTSKQRVLEMLQAMTMNVMVQK